ATELQRGARSPRSDDRVHGGAGVSEADASPIRRAHTPDRGVSTLTIEDVKPREFGLVRLALEAMATRFEVVLDGPDPVRLRAAGEEALGEILRLDRQLSFYRPTSDISWINGLAADDAVRV